MWRWRRGWPMRLRGARSWSRPRCGSKPTTAVATAGAARSLSRASPRRNRSTQLSGGNASRLASAGRRRLRKGAEIGVLAVDPNGGCLVREPGEERLVLELVAVHVERRVDNRISGFKEGRAPVEGGRERQWRLPGRHSVIDEGIGK